YLLFSLVLEIAIRFMVLAVVLVTCCIAGCLISLPYLGAVEILPISIFRRSYSLYYLAQFGQEFDVFAVEARLPSKSFASSTMGGVCYCLGARHVRIRPVQSRRSAGQELGSPEACRKREDALLL